MNRLKFLQLWSVGAGAMDACTGLLLIFLPAQTLTLLGVPPVESGTLAFLSWIGVFVTSVGLSYALVFRGNREAETVWIFTAMVRIFVSAFLVWKISSGVLPGIWGIVAASDLVVAAGQAAMIRAGWWKGSRQ